MSHTRRFTLVSMVLALALWESTWQVFPSTVCSSSGDRERLNESAAVFVGVPVVMMLKETKYTAPGGSTSITPSRLVKFRVSHAWKGVESPFIWVVWGTRQTDDDTSIVVGREYLVFATGTADGQLATWHCGVRDLDRGWDVEHLFDKTLGPAVKTFVHDPGNEPVSCDP